MRFEVWKLFKRESEGAYSKAISGTQGTVDLKLESNAVYNDALRLKGGVAHTE